MHENFLNNKYNIAETFTSIQGEGSETGMLQDFIRLAGCNVGVHRKPKVDIEMATIGQFFGATPLDAELLANPKHTVCCGVDGTEFCCDTNYVATEKRSVQELLDNVKSQAICITGGEPLAVDIFPLVYSAYDRGLHIHIETSGTKLIPANIRCRSFIVCSPKKGFLPENIPSISEFKFVVGTKLSVETTISTIEDVIQDSKVQVYISPINDVTDIRKDSLDAAMQIISRKPMWRLSVQVHKYLSMR